MTREEAIEYWEQFNAEIDDLYDACSDADRDVLVKQREIVEYTISALRQQETVTNRNGLNEPLTLAELRKMDGEPVWIVEYPDWGHWELSADAEDYVTDREPSFYGMKHNDHAGRYGLHKLGWLAYRQKPEEGTE